MDILVAVVAFAALGAFIAWRKGWFGSSDDSGE